MHAHRTAIFCLAACIAASLARADESTFALDIPAQSLNSALGAFAEQTGLQIVYESDLAVGRSSPAVKGKLTASEALDQLLRGTGLDSRILSERAVAISAPATHGTPITMTAPAAGFLRVAEVNVDAQDAPDIARVPAPTAKAEALEEIIVTGSHIRGARSVGSPVTVLTREDMDRTGYTTVQDILKTVTANTGGGPSDERQLGLEQQSNFGAGGSISLRGLGASSTLVLVNGRRQASGGLAGRFTDISSIPATAIERIEILTDGASAVYGSDAVGGVVNIVLRDDFDGAETRLRYGGAESGADETVVGQLFGNTWSSGHAMLAYQYWQRDTLAFADRKFSANSDKRPLGGDNFSSLYSNPGNITNPSTGAPAYGIPHDQDGRSLSPSDLLPGVINSTNMNEGVDLVPTQRMHAAFLSVGQHIGDRVELHADGRFSQREITRHNPAGVYAMAVPSSNPFYVNPFGGRAPVRVYYSFINEFGARPVSGVTETYTGTLGGTLNLNAGWQLDVTGSYGDESLDWVTHNLIGPAGMFTALADPNPATAFNAFGDGANTAPATLDLIRMDQAEQTTSKVWSATAIAQGPLFSLPGGLVKAAVGADYRSERFHRDTQMTGRLDNYFFQTGKLDRQVSAVFGEVLIPVIGSDNRLPGVEDLHLSLAGRYEKYSDFGSTVNPKFGVSWAPSASVEVRATIGTSFRAPNLTDLDERSDYAPNGASLMVVPDAQSPVGQTRILVLTGNNRDLHEETATTWTAGIDVHPVALPDLSLSLTYFDIDYKDRIQRGGPASILDIFRAEQQWAPIITRNPTQAMLAAACSKPGIFLSQQDCLSGSVIVDTRIRNLGVVKLRGLDAKVDYAIPTSFGSFALHMDGSYLFTFDQATTNTSPAIDLIDTVNGPLSFRLRSGVSWALAGFRADASAQYQNSYTDQLSRPTRQVGSLTTVDLHLAYTFAESDAWVDGTQLALSITNAFNRAPPFVNNEYGYDPGNADPIGRILSLEVTKRW